jgi:hypothetical protein
MSLDTHPALGIDRAEIIRSRCRSEAKDWITAAEKALRAAREAMDRDDWSTAGASAARARDAAGQAASLTEPLAPGYIGGLQTAEHRLARSPGKRQEFGIGQA